MTEPAVSAQHPPPIIIPRWWLVTKYVGFMILGTVSAFAGIPTLSEAGPPDFVTVYSILILIAATIAAAGASSPKRAGVEMTGALLLFCLLSAYAAGAFQYFAEGDLRRGAFSIVVLIITLLPGFRGLSLLRLTIRRRIASRPRRA